MPGFVCYHQDKHSNGRGQGVALLVKSNLEHTRITLPLTQYMEAVVMFVNKTHVHYIEASLLLSKNCNQSERVLVFISTLHTL